MKATDPNENEITAMPKEIPLTGTGEVAQSCINPIRINYTTREAESAVLAGIADIKMLLAKIVDLLQPKDVPALENIPSCCVRGVINGTSVGVTTASGGDPRLIFSESVPAQNADLSAVLTEEDAYLSAYVTPPADNESNGMNYE